MNVVIENIKMIVAESGRRGSKNLEDKEFLT